MGKRDIWVISLTGRFFWCRININRVGRDIPVGERRELDRIDTGFAGPAKIADIDRTDKNFWRAARQTVADPIDWSCRLIQG